MYIFLLAVQYLLIGRWFSLSWITICCSIYSRLSLSILKVPYLLHEYPMALLAPTNHRRMKCEKTQINNLFESIQDEDVPYSIVVETITAEETGDMFKRFALHFLNFFIYITYSIRSIRKNFKQHFFPNSEAATRDVL